MIGITGKGDRNHLESLIGIVWNERSEWLEYALDRGELGHEGGGGLGSQAGVSVDVYR